MISTPVRSDARKWPDEQLAELFSEGFPSFITADRLVKEYIGRVRECFAGLDLMLLDADGVPVAAGWGCRCGGTAGPTRCPRGTRTRWCGPWRVMSRASNPTPW